MVGICPGTGANVSDGLRLAILTTFCGPQFRSQENFTLGTSPEVVAAASPQLLALLGFKVWNAYGRLESPLEEFIKTQIKRHLARCDPNKAMSLSEASRPSKERIVSP